MELKANPYRVFEKGNSPLALYAQRKWMKVNDQAAVDRVVKELRRTQLEDGSWEGSVARTIENVFGLWLLGERSKTTEKGINYLLEVGRPAMVHPCYSNLFFGMRGQGAALTDVPFTEGCRGFIKTGAALMLASVLEQGDDERVSKAFATLKKLPAQRGGRWCSASCSNNILQAFASNEKMRGSEGLKLAVKRFEKDQMPNGKWAGSVPFYPTVYALAKVRSKRAQAQVKRAAERIQRQQRSDGSWGSAVNTFMVLEAMERVGEI